MGLFGKKEKKEDSGIPSLPQLPKLPNLPEMEGGIPKHPSFPMNSIGKRFSQDSIKEAVSEERGGSGLYADEFPDEGTRMMQNQARGPLTEEIEEEPEMPVQKKQATMDKGVFRQEAEPVFVRIDKFEDALKTFEAVKSQINEIERMLADTRKLKEKETAELNSWEDELKRMRSEIEKIGMDIFSKV